MPADFTTVVFRSFVVPPDATITIRTNASWEPADAIPCPYNADARQWEARLPWSVPAQPIEFKFLVDGRYQFGQNLVLPVEDQANPDPIVFDDRTVLFSYPNRFVVENPLPAQVFFGQQVGGRLPDTGQRYDVIVIGSGAGGGTLAYKMAEDTRNGSPCSVLLLEAGSYLFPVHVGDLPRRPVSGPAVDKGIWDLWWKHRVQRAGSRGGGEAVDFGEGLNFGGKALFWGALAPRMMPWEFADWPAGVAADLQSRWYAQAESLLRVTPADTGYQSQKQGLSNLQQKVLDQLNATPGLADYVNLAAPLAAESVAPAPGAVPSGIFSTAELLIERKLETAAPRAYDNLTVRLNHEVVRVVPADGDGTVIAYDHLVGRERIYRLNPGGVMVLAAGTLGTPAVVRNSELTVPVDLLGTGLTDHAIYTVSFAIEPGSSWFHADDSSVTLSRHRVEATGPDGRPAHPYNIKMELNTNLSLARYSDRQVFQNLVANGRMPCELVFLLESPLLDANGVRVTGPATPGQLPDLEVTVWPEPIPPAVRADLDNLADVLLAAVDGHDATRRLGVVGAVSHEVGTLRMARTAREGGVRDGVVDSDLRMIGYSNVYVCDLSVFPCSPAANPTLTLAALAHRLADHLRNA